MIYIREIFKQDLRDGKQIAFPKEPSTKFFDFNYQDNPKDRKISFTFVPRNGVNDDWNGHRIDTRLYTARSESRIDGQLKAFLRDNLKAQIGDLLIIYRKEGDNENYTFSHLSIDSAYYAQIHELLDGKNHTVVEKEENEPEEVKQEKFKYPLQQIVYGAPGTGKSFTIDDIVNDNNAVRVTFHPDSDYASFVGAYKPTMEAVSINSIDGESVQFAIGKNGHPGTEKKIVYKYVPQAFLKAYVAAWKDISTPQYLVIEEINRGNCAQIFGDLFQLLDRNNSGSSSYPIHADDDISQFLKDDKKGFAGLDEEQRQAIADYIMIKDNGEQRHIGKQILDGELLLLPPNLHIWATMNTSDQSLFPIDSAFKRRWDWQYIPITDGRKGWKIETNGNLYDWWQFLEKMNDKIGSITNSEDKKLGYFFCKTKDGVISAETFVGKVIFYIWNDVFKDFAEESGDLFRDSDGTMLTFNKFYTIGADGRTEVAEEKITRLFQNLKLESVEEVIEDEDGNSDFSKKRDYSKFSVNGNGKYAKNNLATESIKQYIDLNPDMPAETVIANWKSLGYIVPHFVESKEEYDARTDNSQRSSEIPCGGTVIYVARNGYGNNGQVFKLMDAVNKQDWGLTLAKVEE